MAPIGAALALAFTLAVPQTDPAGLEVLVAEARQSGPRVLAARIRAEAANERIAPAAALPDPMLTFGLMNRPVGDPFDNGVAMTMNQVTVAQRLPWWGRRSAARERFEALARAGDADAREVEEAVVARVRELWYEVAYLDRAVATMRETRELLRAFREVTESLYSVGSGAQADVIQGQIAVAQMTGDLTLMAERRSATVARLNALVGRPPEQDLGTAELPERGPELPAIDRLMALATERRPALFAARERLRAAEATERGAQLNGKPDISLMAGYSQRPEFEDLASLSVGITLPVFGGSKQEPLRRESAALVRAREAEELELLNETYARLTELRAASSRALELERLYRTSILPQARAAVESALSDYQVGRLDFMTLLGLQTTVNRYEIESLRLTADHHIAVAGIEALLDGPPRELDR